MSKSPPQNIRFQRNNVLYRKYSSKHKNIERGEKEINSISCSYFVRESFFEGGPCTPFDPAPLGHAVQEAQGEELVSIPVFSQQV